MKRLVIMCSVPTFAAGLYLGARAQSIPYFGPAGQQVIPPPVAPPPSAPPPPLTITPPYAQPGGPAAWPPPPPPPGFGADLPGEQVSPTVGGKVKRYLLTPVGDVEGLELQDGTDVRFPPHLGELLTSVVKPGDTVAVTGFSTPPTPYGRAIKALTITNVATRQTVVDQPPRRPPPPPWTRGMQMRSMAVSGTIDRYVLNDHGDVDGFFLNNGVEVKFPPHVGSTVMMATAQQQTPAIQVSGYGTSNAFGTVIDAMSGTLAVNGRVIALGNMP